MGRGEVAKGSEHTQTVYSAGKMAGSCDGQARCGSSMYLRYGDLYRTTSLTKFMLSHLTAWDRFGITMVETQLLSTLECSSLA